MTRLLAALRRRLAVARVQRDRRREGWPPARGDIYIPRRSK